MALTLFSRMEGETLDGTDDYSAADTTWTLASLAAFNTSGVKLGTNGLNCPSGDDYATLAAASIVSPSAGCVGFWVRPQTWSDGTWLLNLQGTAGGDRINIELGNASEVYFRHVAAGDHNVLINTTAAGLTTGNWYWLQCKWSSSQDDMRLEVYNAGGTLLEAVQNLSAGIGVAPADIAQINIGTQGTSMQLDVDNLFAGSAYADDFFAKRNITSYTQYAGSTTPAGRGALLGVGAQLAPLAWIIRRRQLLARERARAAFRSSLLGVGK